MQPTHALPITRRRMLKTAGGALLALPFLESFHVRAAETTARRCMIAINLPLGLYGPSLFPEAAEADTLQTEYLKPFAAFHDRMTLISGLYHPGVSNGHVSSSRVFTGTPNVGGPDPRLVPNGESFDQCAARHLGDQTRYASLAFAMGGGQYSWHANGMAVPAYGNPGQVFNKLFMAEAAADQGATRARLAAKGSVLDAVYRQTRALHPALSATDREKLEEYFHAVRETEKRVAKEDSWLDTPKPQVDPSLAPTRGESLVDEIRNVLSVCHLALQTDSTRIITCDLFRQGNVAIDGVNNGYHNLSHHGQDPENVRQLKIIERAVLAELRSFVEKLAATSEPGGGNLLDQTTVVLVSNLGNASSHSSLDLPVVLVGGGLRHGHHLHFRPTNTTPLCNVYLTILQHMGVAEQRFGTSTGTVSQLV